MAPGHHLLVVTFGLCGLLLLLHVDSVSSLKCKECSLGAGGCDSGEVEDGDCEPNNRCGTVVWYFPDGQIRVAARACTDEGDFICFQHSTEMEERIYYCDTDGCNNLANSTFSSSDGTGIACTSP